MERFKDKKISAKGIPAGKDCKKGKPSFSCPDLIGRILSSKYDFSLMFIRRDEIYLISTF